MINRQLRPPRLRLVARWARIAVGMTMAVSVLSACDVEKTNDCMTMANDQVGALKADSDAWKSVYDACMDG